MNLTGTWDEVCEQRSKNLDAPCGEQRAQQTSGTGLGLAVTAEIVERFGGAIRVDSRLGEGTTFAVWLPAVGPPAQPQEEPS